MSDLWFFWYLFSILGDIMDEDLPKIVYLFGAGASAQRLPTIKGLSERIKVVKEFIENNYAFQKDENFSSYNKLNKQTAKGYILEGLDILYNSAQNHSTVDTYAKKLYLIGRKREADEIAFFLALYFNIEQKISGTDPRYTTFLASILDSSADSFPNNLKFLTWNYDLQFEIEYDNLLEEKSQFLNFAKFNCPEMVWDKNKFSSIKLNGSCNFIDDQKRLIGLTYNIKDSIPANEDLDLAMIYAYTAVRGHSVKYEFKVNIDFAWNKDDKYIDKVSELHNETEILVVIGYSFPFFNRKIDRKIIRSMNSLKKIYVQDLNPNNIVSRFLSILPDWQKRNIEIISVDTVDEFFLPPEL